MSLTRNAHTEIQAVRAEYARTRQRIEQDLADNRITTTVAAEQRAAARDTYTARLKAVRATIDEYLDSVTAATAKAREAALASPSGIEAELAAQRIWARYKGVLDSISDAAAHAKALNDLGGAKPSELAVLAAKLPAYLESRGSRRSDVAEAIESQLDAAVDDATYRAAREYQQHAEQVAGVLRMHATRVEKVLEYDPTETPELPQPTGYGSADVLELITGSDPTTERPPLVPGAPVDGAGQVWDPHEQDFVAPAATN